MILQPQSGIDVAGGRGSTHNAPVGAVQIFPGQLLTVVDLGLQLLALVGRTGDEQGAVGDSLLVGSLGGLAVVPILGIVRVLAQTVAGGGQDDLSAVIVQDVRTAGDQAYVDRTGLQTLADSLIGRADGDLHLADLIAMVGQLVLQHLLQGLGGRDDLLGLTGRDKSDLQRLDLLCAALVVLRVVVGVLAAAACQQAQRHDQRQQKCKKLLHFLSSLKSVFLCPDAASGTRYRMMRRERTTPTLSIAHLLEEKFSVLVKKVISCGGYGRFPSK